MLDKCSNFHENIFKFDKHVVYLLSPCRITFKLPNMELLQNMVIRYERGNEYDEETGAGNFDGSNQAALQGKRDIVLQIVV